MKNKIIEILKEFSVFPPDQVEITDKIIKLIEEKNNVA